MKKIDDNTYEFTDFEEYICGIFNDLLDDGFSVVEAVERIKYAWGSHDALSRDFLDYLQGEKR